MGSMVGKIVNYLTLCLLILSSSGLFAHWTKLAPYERYVDEIINSFAKDMRKQYGLICIGNGGRMPNDVEEIDIEFCAYRHATIEEARELFINITEALIKKINEHEKIRPYLREYPFRLGPADEPSFSWCRAAISIVFLNQKGPSYYFLDGSVAHVSQGKGGKIYYSAAELQKRKKLDVIYSDGSRKVGKVVEEERLVDLFEEHFEKALNIVQGNRDKENILDAGNNAI